MVTVVGIDKVVVIVSVIRSVLVRVTVSGVGSLQLDSVIAVINATKTDDITLNMCLSIVIFGSS